MTKRTLIAANKYNVMIQVPIDIEDTGIKDFDDLIYNVYLVNLKRDTSKTLGIKSINSIRLLDNAIIALSKEVLSLKPQTHLFNEWMQTQFNVFLDEDNFNSMKVSGEHCYYILSPLDVPQAECIGIRLIGKCVLKDELNKFNKKYQRISKLYSKNMFDVIKHFNLLKITKNEDD